MTEKPAFGNDRIGPSMQKVIGGISFEISSSIGKFHFAIGTETFHHLDETGCGAWIRPAATFHRGQETRKADAQPPHVSEGRLTNGAAALPLAARLEALHPAPAFSVEEFATAAPAAGCHRPV